MLFRPKRSAVSTRTASAYVLLKPRGSLIVSPDGRRRARIASGVRSAGSFRMMRASVPVYSG